MIAAAAWNIRQAGKPMSADEIPQWELIQETQDSILLQSVAEPDRKTEAFLAGPSDRFGCDTLIMLAGAETGPDFFQLSPEIVEKANTILLIQPFQNFAKYLEKPEDINGWGIFDWWNLHLQPSDTPFKAIGSAFTGGLLTMCNKYGVNVS